MFPSKIHSFHHKEETGNEKWSGQLAVSAMRSKPRHEFGWNSPKDYWTLGGKVLPFWPVLFWVTQANLV